MPPEPTAQFNQLNELLKQIKEEAKYETRLSLLEADMQNYVKETDIHKMISTWQACWQHCALPVESASVPP